MKKNTLLILLLAFYFNVNAQEQVPLNYYQSYVDYNKIGDYASALTSINLKIKEYEKSFGSNDTIYAMLITLSSLLNNKLGYTIEANRLNEIALKIRIEKLGKWNYQVALNLNNLALGYEAIGDYQTALPFSEQALKIRRHCFGEIHPEVASSLNNLASLYSSMGQYSQALKIDLEALDIYKETQGETSIDYIVTLGNLAQDYLIMGNYDKSLELNQIALNIRKEKYGVNHKDVALSLNNLSQLYSEMGQFDKALKFNEEALGIYKNVLGEFDPMIATCLNNLASLYSKLGHYDKALSIQEQALEIDRISLGEEHPDFATSLNNMASMYSNLEQNKKALILYEQALQIRIKSLGENHPDIASSFNNLGFIYSKLGQYEKALSLFKNAYSIRKKILGEVNPEVLIILENIGSCYDNLSQYSNAVYYHQKALSISIKTYSIKHLTVALIMNNLASSYVSIGQFGDAFKLLENCIEIRRSILGNEHPDYATSINNLAVLYSKLGQYEKAIDLGEKALSIKKKSLGEDHSDVSMSLNNLALDYSKVSKFEEAINCYNESLRIKRNVLGENHPDYLISLNNLAVLYSEIGQLDNAIKCSEQVLNILNLSPVEQNLDYALTLNNLSSFYSLSGHYIEASDFNEKALSIYEKYLSNDHPNFATSLSNLALLYFKMGQFEKAISIIEKSLVIENKNNIKILSTLTEDQKISYLKINANSYFFYDALTLTHPNVKGSSSEFSLNNSLLLRNVTLRSKELMRNSLLNSKDSLLVEDYENWLGFKRRYANAQSMTLEEIQNKGIDLKGLEDSIETKERSLSLRSQVFQLEQEKLQLSYKTIKSRLAKDEAFLMFYSFDYYNGKYLSDSVLYAAYVVRPNQKEPVFVKLFEQAQLDSLMLAEDVTSMMGNLYQSSDSALYNLVWKPIARYLGDAKKVYIAPSGQLHKLAFAAIGDGTGHILSDNYEIHQVLSAQDFVYPNSPVLFNSEDKSTNTSIALFGGINYEQSNTTASTKDTVLFSPLSLLSKDLNRGSSFVYLPATQKEIDSIQSQFKQNNKTTLSYSGLEATEASLRLLEGNKAPKILHIATHGYFAPDPKEDHSKAQLQMSGQENRYTAADNPLLRSGLMMAGSNASWKGTVTLPSEDDGILTAQEVSNLNLLNTQLVVLSACETGLGDIKGREGVFGLQRAFRLAGAKYLLLSLWSIPDEETSEYMQLFYAEVLKQNDISKAYKSTQSSMRQKYPNSPMKWAGMVLVE